MLIACPRAFARSPRPPAQLLAASLLLPAPRRFLRAQAAALCALPLGTLLTKPLALVAPLAKWPPRLPPLPRPRLPLPRRHKPPSAANAAPPASSPPPRRAVGRRAPAGGGGEGSGGGGGGPRGRRRRAGGQEEVVVPPPPPDAPPATRRVPWGRRANSAEPAR